MFLDVYGLGTFSFCLSWSVLQNNLELFFFFLNLLTKTALQQLQVQ
jgi:hypothetical protein